MAKNKTTTNATPRVPLPHPDWSQITDKARTEVGGLLSQQYRAQLQSEQEIRQLEQEKEQLVQGVRELQAIFAMERNQQFVNRDTSAERPRVITRHRTTHAVIPSSSTQQPTPEPPLDLKSLPLEWQLTASKTTWESLVYAVQQHFTTVLAATTPQQHAANAKVNASISKVKLLLEQAIIHYSEPQQGKDLVSVTEALQLVLLRALDGDVPAALQAVVDVETVLIKDPKIARLVTVVAVAIAVASAAVLLGSLAFSLAFLQAFTVAAMACLAGSGLVAVSSGAVLMYNKFNAHSVHGTCKTMIDNITQHPNAPTPPVAGAGAVESSRPKTPTTLKQ